MANPEHLAILAKGVEEWNHWRVLHAPVRPELCDADLGRADISRADLSGADLRHAQLAHAMMRDAKLSGADLRRANLHGAELQHADMHLGVLAVADLSQARLGFSDLRGTDLQGTDLSDADLQNANLSGADLSRANLSGAALRRANLERADLRHARLADSDLRGADLHGANLKDANLYRANLEDADLRGSCLGAYLVGATLNSADLRDANLDDAMVSQTKFVDVDLSGTLGLEAVHHDGPSSISVDTIYRSNGKIPDAFLRGCGIPAKFIAQMHSLVNTPFDFYSCFISYASKDQAFADRVHADLQAKGVRAWLATEDLKIGDRFRSRIDESIRVYDRLLLVLSEHSIHSEWVESEVEAAFERERREKRTVLFPIRLDYAITSTNEAWAAEIRRTRHIGDFTEWKRHDKYFKVFERLLRDLKAEPVKAEEKTAL